MRSLLYYSELYQTIRRARRTESNKVAISWIASQKENQTIKNKVKRHGLQIKYLDRLKKPSKGGSKRYKTPQEPVQIVKKIEKLKLKLDPQKKNQIKIHEGKRLKE
ncbi:hypothetical protein M0813_18006 [Anaeramoeba flamelloides]|uniref:Uncharacterized protein n=1 Tax=Anaeramoeba flamelloides TaxID=1746091 RepID=A0ABQ8YU07_9EUKA|nr:hypothetical protein M0813_18006 [Anaeramoeba flamelloides]